MTEYYQVGVALKNGIPEEQWEIAIIYDGDSVLCVFPSSLYGKQQARAVCDVLNATRNHSTSLHRYC